MNDTPFSDRVIEVLNNLNTENYLKTGRGLMEQPSIFYKTCKRCGEKYPADWHCANCPTPKSTKGDK